MPLVPNENPKSSGLSAFRKSARGAYKELVALRAVLQNPDVDLARVKQMVDTAMVHADDAKNMVEDEGGLASLLQGQAGGLNVHIHVHTKD